MPNLRNNTAALWCILLGCQDFNFLPTNGFSIKPLKVKLLAGEQKATMRHTVTCLGRNRYVAVFSAANQHVSVGACFWHSIDGLDGWFGFDPPGKTPPNAPPVQADDCPLQLCSLGRESDLTSVKPKSLGQL